MNRAFVWVGVLASLLGVIYLKTHSKRDGGVTVEQITQTQEADHQQEATRKPASVAWQRQYRFRREISAQSKKPILHFDLRGTLTLSRQEDWVEARFHLDSGQGSSGQHSPAIDSAIPFYFRLSETGAITEFRSSGDPEQQSVLKDLVYLYAFESNQDTTGEFEMKLTASRKQKLKYKGHAGQAIKILKSEHWIRGDHAWMAGTDVTRIGEIENHFKYQLKLEKSFGSATLARSAADILKLPTLALTGVSQAPAAGNGVVPWSKLKPELAGLAQLKSKERMTIFHNLIRTVAVDSVAMNEFRDWMKGQRAQSAATAENNFVFGVGVLGAVGTPQAQTELVSFYQSQKDLSILNAFTTMTSPMTDSTRQFLKERTGSPAEDESNSALFALGSSLRPRDGNPIDESSVNLILAKFNSAPTLSAKLEVLDAMGNSGNAVFFPAIATIIRNAESPTPLMSKAIYALRLMNNSEALALLNQITSDRNYAPYKSIIASTLSSF